MAFPAVLAAFDVIAFVAVLKSGLNNPFAMQRSPPMPCPLYSLSLPQKQSAILNLLNIVVCHVLQTHLCVRLSVWYCLLGTCSQQLGVLYTFLQIFCRGIAFLTRGFQG